MFLQASVILLTGECLPQCMLGYTPRSRDPPEQTPPWEQIPPEQTPREQTPPWEQTDTPTGSRHTPLHSILGDRVNTWVVHILLECNLVNLHIHSMWETICDAQAHSCTHFWNFRPESPLPFQKTSDLRWPKFTLKYPPPISENFRFEMTKVYSKIPPPPILENFRFEMTKVYYEIPPPFQKTSDFRWPKFTLKYPPPQ